VQSGSVYSKITWSQCVGSIPLGAKDGDKYPKAKGGRKIAVTLLFFVRPAGRTHSISESISSYFSPTSRCGKLRTKSFSLPAIVAAS